MAGASTPTRLDIRDPAAVEATVSATLGDRPLDGLVNNAAGNFISRTKDLSPRGFDAIANTVLHGTFYMTQAVGKRWTRGTGGAARQYPFHPRDLDMDRLAFRRAVRHVEGRLCM